MLSKLFAKKPTQPEPPFEPDAEFCIGTLELLVNSLADRQSFRGAFDGHPGWQVEAKPMASQAASHPTQRVGAVLQDNKFELIFGHATQAFVEFMVVDMWVKLRGFTYGGFESDGAGFAASAVLPVGASNQLEFFVQPSPQTQPSPGVVVPGTLLIGQYS